MHIKEILEIVFQALGGLGIFLLGMKNMSEGMQAIAGDKLRRMINMATNNRVAGCMVGTGVTSLIQSSSITTVMVVGMVNAGLMTLIQAIPVIMGANIGTTVTAWILVLKIGKYGLPIIGISGFFYLFSRHDRVRYTAMMVLGLGLVFYGLELMKDGFSPLRDMPEFQAWFHRFEPHGYFGVMRCCLIGAILTAIVQSSSATIGITIGLASQGVINYETAAALVLGENIGTTITAWLASLGANTNAKRASYAHIMFNLLGVLWITTVFGLYVKFIPFILGGIDPNLTGAGADGQATFPNVTRSIAATHTVFNLINVLLFLPFSPMMARFLSRMIKERKPEEVPHLTFLDIRMLDTPAISIEQSRKEILRMSDLVVKNLASVRECMAGGDRNEEVESKVFHREEVLDILQKEVVEYLSDLLTGNVPHGVVLEGRDQLRMAEEYESIGDYIEMLMKLHLKRVKSQLRISPEGATDILRIHDHVVDYVQIVNAAVAENRREVLSKAITQGEAITHMIKESRSSHLVRVSAGDVSPLKSLIFTDMLTAYRRIKDHALNIAEVVGGAK